LTRIGAAFGPAGTISTKLLAELDAGRQPRTSATVDQLMERYVEIVRVETSTRQSYEGLVRNHIVPLLDDQQVGSVRERCEVMGYSQGGAVALQLAVRHPQLCNKLVIVSATYRPDGWSPSVPRAIDGLTGDDLADTPIGVTIRRNTADPRAFDAYIEKMKVLGVEDHDISDAQMRSIQESTRPTTSPTCSPGGHRQASDLRGRGRIRTCDRRLVRPVLFR
jgi:pimeloyl-ACP methyl ester carboxylesterase